MKINTIVIFLILSFGLEGFTQRDFSNSDTIKLIILGSGNPNPSPSQSGCSVAIVVFDTPYIIDFGPGIIRKAAAMTPSVMSSQTYQVSVNKRVP